MISFDAGKRRFNLRAAAIILDGSRVLLHRCEGDDFWTFPGGRVDAGEVAAATVERELREELDERVTCGELVWLVENFFNVEIRPSFVASALAQRELGFSHIVHRDDG